MALIGSKKPNLDKYMRPGQPAMLVKGQPIPQDLLRAGQPDTIPSDFHGLPLAQQMTRLGEIDKQGQSFADNYYKLPNNPFDRSGYGSGPKGPSGYRGGSGIGDGMIERQNGYSVPIDGSPAPVAGMQPMQQQMPEQQPAKRRPNWLGILGDSLQILGGGQATYVPQMQEQRQRAETMRQRALEAQQARETGWQDWVKKQEYERANPAPVNNDTVNDLNWYKGLTEADRALYHQMKPVVGYMADGTPRIVNPMEVGKSNQGDALPVIEDNHQYTPGAGGRANPANWKPIGGAASNGGNGFR